MLSPGDVLVNINERDDPYSRLKRWAVGPYEHIFMYMGRLFIDIGGEAFPKGINVPMLFESNGRGCCLRSLSERYGEDVVVMRAKWRSVEAKLPQVINEAIKLASDLQARYDYSVIATHIIPQLVLEKLHLPIPLRYHRDKLMVCSEACAECFWRSDIEILPRDIVPLPGDFVEESPALKEAGRGKLSPEWV